MGDEKKHQLVTPEGVVKEAPESFITENGGWGKLKEQGWSLPSYEQLKGINMGRRSVEEKDLPRKLAAQPKEEAFTDPYAQAISQGAEEAFTKATPVGAALNAISPDTAKKVAPAAGGFLTGIVKSATDLPVAGLGLLERGVNNFATGGQDLSFDTGESDLRKGINQYERTSEELSRTKPYSTGAGEVLGTIGQAVTGAGAPGAIAKVGAFSAEKIAAKIAVKEASAVAGKGLLRKVAAKAGGAAAAGGIENVLFNLADLDAKLEADPAPTIGKYAAGAGLDFLLGAGIGLGAAGAGAAAKGLSRKLGSAAERLASKSAGLKQSKDASESGKLLLDSGLLSPSAEETLTNVTAERNKVAGQIRDKVVGLQPDLAPDLDAAIESGRGGYQSPATWRGADQAATSVRPPGVEVSGGEPQPNIGTKWFEGVQDPEMGKAKLDDVLKAQDIYDAGGTTKGKGIHKPEKLQGLGAGEDVQSVIPGGYLKDQPALKKILDDNPMVKRGEVSPDALAQWIGMMKKPDVPLGQAILKYTLNPEDSSWMGRKVYNGITIEPGETKVVPPWEGGTTPKGEGGTVPPVESSGPEHIPGNEPMAADSWPPSSDIGEAATQRPQAAPDLGSLQPPKGIFEFPATKQTTFEDVIKGKYKGPKDAAFDALVDKHAQLTKLEAALQGAAKEQTGTQDMLGVLKNIGKGVFGLEALGALTGHANPQTALMAALGGVALGLAKPSDAFAAKAMSKGARALGVTAGAEWFENAARIGAEQLVRQVSVQPTKHPLSNRERYNVLKARLAELQDNPEEMNKLVDQHVGPGAGPQTRMAASMAITGVVGHLQTKLPQDGQPDPLRPNKQRPPPDSAVDGFLMSADGADGPRFMELLGQGRVTKQRWDSFAASHPEGVDVVRRSLLKEIGNAPDLDWRQRQQIGLVFDIPTYGSTPDLVRTLQSRYDSAEEQKQAEDQEARIAGKTKTFSEKPYLTDTDRAEMGER